MIIIQHVKEDDEEDDAWHSQPMYPCIHHHDEEDIDEYEDHQGDNEYEDGGDANLSQTFPAEIFNISNIMMKMILMRIRMIKVTMNTSMINKYDSSCHYT